MRLVLLFISICFFYSSSAQPVLKRFVYSGAAQGTTFSVSYYHEQEVVKPSSIDSLFRSIDSSLSIYKPYSLISRFNESASGLHIDLHLKNVVNAALVTFRQTDGLFDITIKPLMDAWGLGIKEQTSLPDSSEIKAVLECIGSNKLSLKDHFLGKSNPCVQIDVNGIAQGYTVDVIADYLNTFSIKHYIIELGGEIKVKGRKQPSGEVFTVGIETPSDDLLSPMSVYKTIHLDSGSITTSGNYRKYIEAEGKRITHIIDPRTGYSYTGNILSVTLFAPDAITADAYDNALLLLPLKEGLRFVDNHNELAAYFIYRDEDGIIKGHASTKFKALLKN